MTSQKVAASGGTPFVAAFRVILAHRPEQYEANDWPEVASHIADVADALHRWYESLPTTDDGGE